MRNDLKEIVEQLAVKGFRTAGGARWNEVMQLMQNLITRYISPPDIQSWQGEHGVEYRNFSCIFQGKSSKKIVNILSKIKIDDKLMFKKLTY